MLPPRIRVLVVEDDDALRELYKRDLTSAGYSVITVADGVDALHRLEEGVTPHVVLLDLELPRLSGLDVYREMKAHPRTRNVPIIVVTGTDTRDLTPSDFAFVFRKPVVFDALAKAIDAAAFH